MRSIILAALATAIPLAAAHPCSFMPWPSYRTAREVHFIGTALGDTTRAGPGAVRAGTDVGHSGVGRRRIVYGQRVRIERVGAPWRTMIPVGATEAIMVPWDYDASCRTVYWGRSARWARPGTRAVFRGRLRERGRWVGGVPTLDVMRVTYYAGEPDAQHALTVPEFLDLIEALPDADEVRRDPVRATAPMRRWIADHPDWERMPWVNEPWGMVDGSRSILSTARWSEFRSPIAGTYRVEVALPGETPIAFFSRTQHGREGESLVHRVEREPDGRPDLAYELLAIHARTEAELPDTFPGWPRLHPTHHAVFHAPITRSAGPLEWRGLIDGLAIAAEMEPDSSRAARLRRLHERADSLRPDEWFYTPGTWTMGPSLPVEYRWEARGRNGELFYTVTAKQVSSRTFRP